MKPSAKFLNAPRTACIATSGKWKKYVITMEPLVVQYAGDPIPKEEVSKFIASWRAGYNYEDPNFNSKEYLENLAEYYFPLQSVWVIPAGRVTDGPSVPRSVFWIKPEDFHYSGIWHDWARGYFTLGNASTDGILRDLARHEGVSRFAAYQVYLGVRIGTHTRYKCPTPPPGMVEATYARKRGLERHQVKFDPQNFEVHYSLTSPQVVT